MPSLTRLNVTITKKQSESLGDGLEGLGRASLDANESLGDSHKVTENDHRELLLHAGSLHRPGNDESSTAP